MLQYEMYFTNEYLFDIIDEISDLMGINYDKDKLSRAFEVDDTQSVENLFIVHNIINPEYFICVDCNNKDWIYPLVVRCSISQKDSVNRCMLQWDNKIREEYGQKLTESINDSYNNADSLLKRIEANYSIQI